MLMIVKVLHKEYEFLQRLPHRFDGGVGRCWGRSAEHRQLRAPTDRVYHCAPQSRSYHVLRLIAFANFYCDASGFEPPDPRNVRGTTVATAR